VGVFLCFYSSRPGLEKKEAVFEKKEALFEKKEALF